MFIIMLFKVTQTETTRLSFNQVMDKRIVHTMDYYSVIKMNALVIHTQCQWILDASFKWKKSDSKGYILDDYIFMKIIEKAHL